MNQISNKQMLHRQYLQSELWKNKRLQAIAHYGPQCNRCGGDGGDVHHRTYKRWGGGEKMEDLEILCRGCHEAHHRIERVFQRKKNRSVRHMDRGAIARYLTQKQRDLICAKFNKTWGDVYTGIVCGEDHQFLEFVLRTIGKEMAFKPMKKKVVSRMSRVQLWVYCGCLARDL